MYLCLYIIVEYGCVACWNLLESTPARIPLIELSHKYALSLYLVSLTKYTGQNLKNLLCLHMEG